MFQRSGALPIIVPLMATGFGLIGKKCISRLMRKTNQIFFKQVLIEQAELDRLQQRQLYEHSPNFQAIVRIVNNMKDISTNK